MHYAKAEPKTIQSLFDHIAPSYQATNKVISFGLDYFWRKSLINSLPEKASCVLDLCTGSGDLIGKIRSKYPQCHIVGLDFSRQMLNVACQSERHHSTGFIQGDVHDVPFKDNSFDLILLSFSIRNFKDVPLFFKEVHRVLKPEGKFAFLELVKPKNKLWRHIYFFYLKKIMPVLAACVSGQPKAYQYLADSIETFYEMDELFRIIGSVRLKTPKVRYLLGQGAAIISGEK